MNVVRVKTKELYLKSRYLTKTVSYWQWCLLKEKVEKDGKVVTFQKTVKLKKECTVRELVDTFNDEFRKDFCRLIFNIRHQFQQASKCKAELCYYATKRPTFSRTALAKLSQKFNQCISVLPMSKQPFTL